MTSPTERRAILMTSVVVASKDQVSSDLAGETVLLSMTSARYYGLDGVSQRIWELLREPVRVSEICTTIAAEYDVAADRSESDVLRFLGDLASKGLIEVRLGE